MSGFLAVLGIGAEHSQALEKQPFLEGDGDFHRLLGGAMNAGKSPADPHDKTLIQDDPETQTKEQQSANFLEESEAPATGQPVETGAGEIGPGLILELPGRTAWDPSSHILVSEGERAGQDELDIQVSSEFTAKDPPNESNAGRFVRSMLKHLGTADAAFGGKDGKAGFTASPAGNQPGSKIKEADFLKGVDGSRAVLPKAVEGSESRLRHELKACAGNTMSRANDFRLSISQQNTTQDHGLEDAAAGQENRVPAKNLPPDGAVTKHNLSMSKESHDEEPFTTADQAAGKSRIEKSASERSRAVAFTKRTVSGEKSAQRTSPSPAKTTDGDPNAVRNAGLDDSVSSRSQNAFENTTVKAQIDPAFLQERPALHALAREADASESQSLTTRSREDATGPKAFMSERIPFAQGKSGFQESVSGKDGGPSASHAKKSSSGDFAAMRSAASRAELTDTKRTVRQVGALNLGGEPGAQQGSNFSVDAARTGLGELDSFRSPKTENSGKTLESSIDRLPEQTLRFVEGMRRDGSRFYQAKLRLNPPELGHMKVELRMENEQVQARFIVENHAARDQVQAELTHLRAALSQQDLSDARIDVQIDQGEAQAGQESAGEKNAAREALGDQPEEQSDAPITVRASLHDGLIDTRA